MIISPKRDRKSDPMTRTAQKEDANLHPAKRKLIEQLEKGIYPETICGVFSPEEKGSDGYIEEIIRPESGGTFIKIYGCHALYKGYPKRETVQGLQLAKAMVSNMLYEFIKTFPFVLLSFLFRRKKVYSFAEFVFRDIELKVVQHYDIPENEYNVLTKELKRAVYKVCAGHKHETLYKQIINFVCLVLEVDNGYRYRIQDALRNDVIETLQTLISHENSMKYKWKRPLALVRFLRFLPEFKLLQAIFKELDLSKTKLDEDDLYFAYRMKQYSVQGLPPEHRNELVNMIDIMNNNLRLI